jgi:hypothetical protein
MKRPSGDGIVHLYRRIKGFVDRYEFSGVKVPAAAASEQVPGKWSFAE